MDKELEKRVSRIIESVMGINVEGIDRRKRFDQIGEWDSFNNLMLISRMQEEFKIEFTAVEIEETKNLEQLFSLMEKKTNN